MIVIVYGCSGRPGYVFEPGGEPLCPNEAVAWLWHRGVRKSRICVDHAVEFEELCTREGLPMPEFELIPEAAELVTDDETRHSGGSSSEPPAPSSTEEGAVSDAEPPESKKSGGSDVGRG